MLSQIEIGLLALAVERGRTFVDDWNDDEGMDAFSRSECNRHLAEQEAAEAILARLQTVAVEGAGEPTPIRVVVTLEGGVVQGAVADREGVTVDVVDYDTDGSSPAHDEIRLIPQGERGEEEGYIGGGHRADCDPAWIDALDSAKLAYPAEYAAGCRKAAAETDSEPYRKMLIGEAEQAEAQLAAEGEERVDAALRRSDAKEAAILDNN